MTVLAISGNDWLEVILAASFAVPLTVLGFVVWFVLRGRNDDPDEQRWRRLEEQQRENDSGLAP